MFATTNSKPSTKYSTQQYYTHQQVNANAK